MYIQIDDIENEAEYFAHSTRAIVTHDFTATEIAAIVAEARAFRKNLLLNRAKKQHLFCGGSV
jgi:hypothetical protein